MRTMAATVLGCEAFVVFFALLVAKDLSHLPLAALVGVGATWSVGCLLVAGLLRHRWAYAVGSALQVLLVVAGTVVTVMYALGLVFTVLWVLALYLGRRYGDPAGLGPGTR